MFRPQLMELGYTWDMAVTARDPRYGVTMSDSKFRLEATEDHTAAFLYLPTNSPRPKPKRLVDLSDILDGYGGHQIIIELDDSGNAIGVEVLMNDVVT